MAIELKATELLFIDTLHTYAHLTLELEKFSSKVSKYIALHDTSPPWGHQDDIEYRGDYSEYPSWIERNKRGLWPAVVDFLQRHPEWELHRRYQNCHGLTILRRKSASASLPPPYDSVELLPFDPQGWYANGEQMERLFVLRRPKVVIEVGSWAGASTRHMASMLPPGGVVYAVDHWKGSVEHQPGQGWWSPILPRLYEQFLSNVIHAGLTHEIVPVRMSSKEASAHLADIQADLIYIDGSHDYDSVLEDLNVWYPRLSPDGVLCGDDWGYPDICKAVHQFAKEKGLKVIHPGAALWYLTK